jgi:hypothetical protein
MGGLFVASKHTVATQSAAVTAQTIEAAANGARSVPSTMAAATPNAIPASPDASVNTHTRREVILRVVTTVALGGLRALVGDSMSVSTA